jgi:hypothetical protein
VASAVLVVIAGAAGAGCGGTAVRDNVPKSVHDLTRYTTDLKNLDQQSRGRLAKSGRDARYFASKYASLERRVKGSTPSGGTSDERALWRLFTRQVHLRYLAASSLASHLDNGNRYYAAEIAAINEKVLRTNWEFNNVLAHFRGGSAPPRDTACDGAGFALLLSRAHADLNREDAILQRAEVSAVARKDLAAYTATLTAALPVYARMLARLRTYASEANSVSSFFRGGWQALKRSVSVRETAGRTILSALRTHDQNNLVTALTAASRKVESGNAEWKTFANSLNGRLAPCTG